jgi:hypothetical protein
MFMAAKLTRLVHKIANCSCGTELYHLLFSLQAASPETFEYTLVTVPNRALQTTPDEM